MKFISHMNLKKSIKKSTIIIEDSTQINDAAAQQQKAIKQKIYRATVL